MTSGTNGTTTGENPVRNGGGKLKKVLTSKALTSKSGLSVLTLLAALLFAMTLIIATIEPPEITERNAAAILALVPAGAFAIERLIEFIWIVVWA